ncbi:MAG: DNA repair protein RecO [Alphaproteobacteria bacterium PA4]|nr:MAG: DNA repair protein RecO [Alphaproteobacteria bacterium PA4]
MLTETDAIVLTALPHGEHGAVVRFLTPAHGLVAGYVHGGRGRSMRPVLQAGNGVALTLKARTDTQLATATVELTAVRAALVLSGSGLAALEWLTALTVNALAEAVPHPALFHTLAALVGALAAGADLTSVGESIVRYELLLLAELGFGLDLAACAATGVTSDLAYVSPKSSQAVSRAAGQPWAARLLPLPAFLIGDALADLPAIRDGLRLTGHFLARDVLNGRKAEVMAVRQRLVARLG